MCRLEALNAEGSNLLISKSENMSTWRAEVASTTHKQAGA